MKILALEFSSQQRSVAIVDESGVLSEITTDQLKTGPLVLIEQALQQAQIGREEIQRLGIGIGPGSYTGIRSAIAVAQGWQLARDTELCAVSSAETLAATARGNDLRGETHFIIDAQRHEYYHCTWQLYDQTQQETSPLSIIGVTAAAELKAHGPDAAGFPSCEPLYPSATALARLAMERSDHIQGCEIEPIYLRPTEFTKAPPPRQL
ncbi:MAG: tRNA (adenosine(37)-N6)-threonylcarbamoyltransferase complex dimerization subunit type 1 TsaB [Limisphaerales bacterium]